MKPLLCDKCGQPAHTHTHVEGLREAFDDVIRHSQERTQIHEILLGRYQMTRDHFSKYMENTFTQLVELNKKAQKEYTLRDDAFDNFNRVAKDLELDRKKVLLVYLKKHLDGITSYCNGHELQRESVHGRINDAVVYLMLLHGMIAEDKLNERPTPDDTRR